jgi:hypothetical protein
MDAERDAAKAYLAEDDDHERTAARAFLSEPDGEPAKPTGPVVSGPEAAVQSFAQGGTLGLADKLGAIFQGGLQAVTQPRQASPAASNQVVKQALAENQQLLRAGEEQHPYFSAAGDTAGTVATLGALPPVRAASASVAPAAEALGGGFLARAGARGVMGAALGQLLGKTRAAFEGHPERIPEAGAQGLALGGAGAAAPLPTAGALGLSGLLDTDPHSAAQKLAGAAAFGVGGALDAVGGAGPGAAETAELAAARAARMNLKAMRKAGGVQGARDVGRALLSEKVLPFGGTTEDVAENVLNRAADVGSQYGKAGDTVSANMPPEARGRLTPSAISEQVARDILPERESTAALRRYLGPAKRVVRDIQSIGEPPGGIGPEAPLPFSELIRQRTAYDREAYKAADPRQPNPNAEVLQDTRQSLSRQLDDAGSRATGDGSAAFEKWLETKARYGPLAKASDSLIEARMRDVANNRLSLREGIMASPGDAGGLSRAGLLHLARTRGETALARTADAVARGADAAGRGAVPLKAVGAESGQEAQHGDDFLRWILHHYEGR